MVPPVSRPGGIMRPSKLLSLFIAAVSLAVLGFVVVGHSRGGAPSGPLARSERIRAQARDHQEKEGPTDISALRELGGLNGVGPTAAQLAAIGAQQRAIRATTRATRPDLAQP